jgi:anti-sigma regulatory factor (Ser/Thr protein kinase)
VGELTMAGERLIRSDEMPETSTAHRRYAIGVAEDVGELRRGVSAEAARLAGVSASDAELVATELATNVLRHATGGYLLTRSVAGGLELVAVDHGPGMPLTVVESLTAPPPVVIAETTPSAGGLGVGLAGVRRRTSTFDCYSTGRGTVMLARLGRLRTTAARSGGAARWRCGGVSVPFGGMGSSGDAYAVSAGRGLAAMVVDGLGHGPKAAIAAQAAIEAFGVAVSGQPGFTPQQVADFVRQAHQSMRSTRGGVLAVGVINPHVGHLNYCGVGNIASRILTGGDAQHLLSRPGMLGTELPIARVRQETYSWAPGATLVLASDGIDSRWNLAAYPGLLDHDPVVIAATVYRDHARKNDDATVLVVRDSHGHDSAGGRP